MRRDGGVAKLIRNGGIVVMPTDTILGVVASAKSPRAVERLYRLRKRERAKPFIVLIASAGEVKQFGIIPTPRLAALLNRVWPGPVSVVLLCPAAKFRYLHRGTGSLAFRVPQSAALRRFLRAAGPLVAPSANRAGESPCRTVREARAVFGAAVDVYMPGRVRSSAPSVVLKALRW